MLVPFFTRFSGIYPVEDVFEADTDGLRGSVFSIRTKERDFDRLPVYRFMQHPLSYPRSEIPAIEWSAEEILLKRGVRDVFLMFKVDVGVSAGNTPMPCSLCVQ